MRVLVTLIMFTSILVPVSSLTVTGEIYDGTPQDIAAGDGVIYLAQGRYLSLLDPETGQRIGNHNGFLYPSAVIAVEYDIDTDTIITATEKAIYIYRGLDEQLIWHNNTGKSIVDIKSIPPDNKVIAVISDEVYIIDYSGEEAGIVSRFNVPEGIMYFVRLHLAHTRNGWMAYLTGILTGQQIRGINGLIIADLDSAHGYENPLCYGEIWNPVSHFGSPAATVRNVAVYANQNHRVFAYVACGLLGQLTVLDVTEPDSIGFIENRVLARDFPVSNLIFDSFEPERLYVASMNILHILDRESLETIASVNAGFFDAGNRDMALYRDNGQRILWTATNFSVDYVINAVDVGTNRPWHAVRKWWISSSDGAVAIPQWNSLYLPTFGGIVRYDISDLENPVAVDESYQPAGGTIEHIELLFPVENNLRQAVLLTAPGNGGVQVWEISTADPNPQPPVKVSSRPSHWENDPVYQNDVGWFRKNGVIYYLADLANRRTNELALQIYNTAAGEWLNVFVNHPDLKSNCVTVTVSHEYEYAMVSCRGGFFVVDLADLPHSAQVSDIVVNDWNEDGSADDVAALVLSNDSQYLFIAHDPGVIQSYEFNTETGTVFGPLDILTGDDISGCTSRGRYHDRLKRLYIAGRGGNIMEVDVSDPHNLQLLSVWNNGGYRGEMQDCRIYTFGEQDVVLAVKNNEGFAFLKIEEESSSINEERITEVRNGISLRNFPNPFNPETVIEWDISASGDYTLTLFDVKGLQIRKLFSGFKDAGKHQTLFEAQDLPSGIYFYRLEGSKQALTEKMLLLR